LKTLPQPRGRVLIRRVKCGREGGFVSTWMETWKVIRKREKKERTHMCEKEAE